MGNCPSSWLAALRFTSDGQYPIRRPTVVPMRSTPSMVHLYLSSESTPFSFEHRLVSGWALAAQDIRGALHRHDQ